MKLNKFLMTPKNSSPDFFSSSSQIPKPARQLSVPNATTNRNQYITKQRRQHISAVNNDFVYQRTAASLSVPLLIEIMNTFFQTTQSMEDEIMLPSRLKDMPVEQIVFENTVQPDSWHQVYSFIREMRNQLRSAHPFADDEGQIASKEPPPPPKEKDSNVDEGIIISNQDNIQFSCASSIASSDESERSSGSSNGSSYETIKDELKFHYYGLFRTLDNLTSLASHVTDKYREEYLF